jgi:chromosome partitioning protein
MKTLVIASGKGGVGKTTLAAHLAIAAEAAGAGHVAILDTDPQGSLSKWWNKRKAPTPLFAGIVGSLSDTLAGLADRGVALAIVDTPPALSASIAATVAAADLVLVPVTPSPLDLEAVGATVGIVQSAGKAYAFVVNRGRRNSLLTADTAEALQRHGEVANAIVEDRLDFRTGLIQGQTAQEYAPKGRAAAEMAELWAYVAGRLA